MTRSQQAGSDCPSWSSLLRFVAEGGPWPVEHLRTCDRCRERRTVLQSLMILGDSGQTGPASRDCPEIADLVALLDDDLSDTERYEIGEHLCECERCAALLREAVAVEGGESLDWEVRESAHASTMVLADAEASPMAWWQRAFPRRAVALAILGLGLAAVVLSPFPAIDSGASDRWRGPTPTLQAELTRPPGADHPTVSWSDWEGAGSFRVRVWSETGERVFERHVAASDVNSVELVLPQDVVGRIVVWQVDALNSGEVLATSGPVEFSWEPR